MYEFADFKFEDSSQLTDSNVVLGEVAQFQLECNSKYADVKWFKGGVEVNSTNRYICILRQNINAI